MSSVVVPTTASGAGAPVAVDVVSSAAYQQVKLVAGSIGVSSPIDATSGVAAAGSVGLVVAPLPGQSVTIQQGASVVAQVSGVVTMTPGVSVTISGQTVNVGSISATVNVNVVAGGAAPGTTAGTQTNISGQVIWLAPTQTVIAGTSVSQVISTILGTQVITLATGGTIASVLGTVAVNVVAGGAAPGTTAATQTNVTAQVVWLAPTQTINVTIVAGAGGGGSVTVSPPSISATGQVVWIAGGQSTTAFPIWVSQINPPAGGGGSVTVGTPTATATAQLMRIVGGQTATGDVVFVSQINPPAGGGGSVTVSIPTATATGQMMWIVGGQTATGAPVIVTGSVAIPAVSISVSAVLGTVITQLGTQIVTLATGGVVTMVGAVSVTGVSLNVVVSGPVSVSAMPAISISVSAALGTVITILGTQIVSVAGASVYVTNPASAASGIGVYLVGLSTTALSGVTGPVVWLGASQSVIVNTIAAGFSVNALVTGPVSISAMPAVSISVSAVLGTVVTLLGTVAVNVVAGGAAPGTTAGTQTNISGQVIWLAPTQTIIVGTSVSQVISTVLGQVAVSLSTLLLTTLQPSVSAAGIVVWQANPAVSVSVAITGISTVGTILTILSTVVVQVSGAVLAVLTQTAVTGAAVWLAPTQTIMMSGMSITTGHPDLTATGQIVRGVMLGSVTGSAIYQELQVNTTGQLVVVISSVASVAINRPAGMVVMTVTSTSVIATSTTQFMLLTVKFDAYTSAALVSGYTVAQGAFQFTGVTMVFSGTSITASSVIVALYVTTSGVSLTSNAVQLWSTVIPTLTGAAIVTVLPFPFTFVLPAGGVMGLAVFRQTSLTVTINAAFSITGQYLN